MTGTTVGPAGCMTATELRGLLRRTLSDLEHLETHGPEPLAISDSEETVIPEQEMGFVAMEIRSAKVHCATALRLVDQSAAYKREVGK